jgi:hypothetical protein
MSGVTPGCCMMFKSLCTPALLVGKLSHQCRRWGSCSAADNYSVLFVIFEREGMYSESLADLVDSLLP